MCPETREAVIVRMREAFEKVRTAELERLYRRIPTLTVRSRDEIRRLSDVLVASILDPPLQTIGEDMSDEMATSLLDAVQRLFQLNGCDAATTSCG